jgi:putative photosynthetic complex assembly protein
MSALDDRPFPRGAVIGAGILIGATLLFVGAFQWTKFNNPPAPEVIDETEIVQQRQIRFTGDPKSKSSPMSVFDAGSGEKIADLLPNDGFVRTVLASMAFDRGKRGVTEEPTYRLIEWADSRVTIEDVTTGIKVNTGAFSPESKLAFKRFFGERP